MNEGSETKTSEVILTNKVKDMKKRILGVENKIEEMEMGIAVIEGVKSKKEI